jgi:DNA-binding CsgD family transcriptional regulator
MRSAVTEASQYELVELVYAAAQAPEEWQRVVTRFAETFAGVSAALMVKSAGAEGGAFVVHAMFSPGAIPEFLRNFSESSPWVPLLRTVETGVPFASEDRVPIATIRNTPFYKNFLKPYSIGGCFGVKLWDRSDGRALFVATCAEAQLATMKIALLPVLKRLAPHIERSLSLCWALRRERARGLEDGLSRQTDAVFVLNQQAEVVYQNAAARRAVAEAVVRVSPANPKLRLVTRKDNAKFDALFSGLDTVSVSGSVTPTRHQASVIASAVRPRQLMTFQVAGSPGLNLLEIIPLAGASSAKVDCIFRDRQKEPHALVTVRRRNALTSPAIGDIRTVFQLSQKEAEVTLALVEGVSLEDYASSKDITVDTVRWHLKNIYRRTECKNQADLVRLVLSLVGRANLS